MNSKLDYYNCKKLNLNINHQKKLDTAYQCPVINSCNNTGASITVPANTPTIVGTINVNTECLNNPCTKITFTAFTLSSISIGQTLSFQLIKRNLCNPRCTVNIGNPITLISGITFAVGFRAYPFNIDFCDCSSSNSCYCTENDCNQYSIIATSSEDIRFQAPTLSAISTCNGSFCCSNQKYQCPTIINCSNTGSTIEIPADTATIVGTVTVNTSCLDNPCTKITFTGSTVSTIAQNQIISFQLVKCNTCSPGNITNVGNPVVLAFNLELVLPFFSLPFNITLCDCNSFNDCCYQESNCTEYSVIMTSSGDLRLQMPTVSAISTCNGNSCCRS